MAQSKEPIPGYKILDNIGEGGFARVYLAEQITLQRNVALKVMSPKLSDDIEYCERFLREGRTLARLSNHPDIVTIHDIGKVDRYYYMAMEYLEGSDLKSRITSSGFDGDCLAVIRTVAGALAYAHRAGVVHRDIKPANVLFSQAGNAVLSDFGIAKSLKETDDTLTVAGTQIGTPSYMSPEQCRGEADIDGRSDLYSLGVMFFEMLSGRKPYTGTDHLAVIIAHLNNPLPELPETVSQYQPILNRLMAKSRTGRYDTADQLLTDLAALEQQPGEPVPARNDRFFRYATVTAMLAVAAGFFLVSNHINKPVAEVALTAVPSAGLAVDDHEKVQRLLDSGQMHEIVGRHIAPPGSNALDAYRVVLEIDPANAYARDAVARLEKKYGKP